MGDEVGSFPRQQARTRRFSLGSPRNFTLSPDGQRVVFLRSARGDDAFNSLWVYDTTTGAEREVANPALLGTAQHQLSQQERARRERSRELGSGIVSYACDEAMAHAVFGLGDGLWWVGLMADAGAGAPVRLPSPADVVSPRPDPSGAMVAFLSGPRLCLVGTSGASGYTVLAEESGEVTWGAAEFVAAEEMGRARGFWWAPDGSSLLAARVDNSPVTTWWTADPSRPAVPPERHTFPVAGSDDAVVSLWHLPVGPAGGGERCQVQWDAGRYPYLAVVHWGTGGPPLLLVEQRDHKACAVLAADLSTGTTSAVAVATDGAWVDWPPGVPAWLEDGQLVWAEADSSTWRLKVGAALVTPPGLQVREVTSAGQSVVFTASQEPEVVEAWEWSAADGLQRLTDAGGVSAAYGQGPARVIESRSLAWDGPRAEVRVDGSAPRPLKSNAETPVVTARPRFLRVGPRRLSVGVVLPQEHPGGKLPVVMAPYGGPGHQAVLASRSMWLQAQWFANQGFAVVVADGRGTPGRGPDFEHEVYLDLAQPVLEDQVEALYGAAEQIPELDLGRVGIMGWSFGGYLSALAVLSRPDVFHAAVGGAPVTDWRLYDTYYTERYLGHPADQPDAYHRCSLLPLAAQLCRPLLLVHGLADDNVYAAHTLELSSALLVADRRHSVLPLPGVTHVAGREDVAESLLLYELDFFRQALAGPGWTGATPAI